MTVLAPSVESLELERELTDEARAWHARAREFSDEAVRPVGQVLDRMDHREAVAPGSPVFDFIAQAHREGFTRLTDPLELGGAGLTRSTEYVVLEELATADAGLTALLIAAPLPFRWARTLGSRGLAAALSAPYLSGAASDLGRLLRRRQARPAGSMRAPDGDGWRLTAATSPRVPRRRATATHAMLSCSARRRDRAAHALRSSRLARDGVGRPLPHDLLGLRAQSRARIVLDQAYAHRRRTSDLVGRRAERDRRRPRAPARVHRVSRSASRRAAYEGTLRWSQRASRRRPRLMDHAESPAVSGCSRRSAGRARGRPARSILHLPAAPTPARAARSSTPPPRTRSRPRRRRDRRRGDGALRRTRDRAPRRRVHRRLRLPSREAAARRAVLQGCAARGAIRPPRSPPNINDVKEDARHGFREDT